MTPPYVEYIDGKLFSVREDNPDFNDIWSGTGRRRMEEITEEKALALRTRIEERDLAAK